MTALEHIMDAIDIETYLICKDENEGRMLALQLGKEMNIGDVDIMFMEFDGYG
jgi:alkyl hydroperoxide reductase subunit AhpF